MNIESIKTDKDATQFVSEYGIKNNMEWGKVSFNNLNGMFSQNKRTKSELAFLDSLTKTKWIKSDFNTDGKLDLIFSGRIYTQLAVLAFMSNGDSIVCHYLGTSLSSSYPSAIGEIKSNELSLLEIKYFVRIDPKYEIRNSYRTDSLIYKFGGFVEPNYQKKEKIKFDSIVCKVSATWMSLVNIPKMTIYPDGKVKLLWGKSRYNRDSVPWINSEFVSHGHMNDVKDIENFLEYIDFLNLKTNYAIGYVTDLGTSVTTVYYNGKSKSVSDYGSHGTYGLNLLYQKFGRIKSKSFPKSAE